MNEYRTLNIGQFLLIVGGVSIRLVFALLGRLREVFASVDIERSDDRQLHDADLIGEYNHRTGRLDAGNDPYGWYDEG